MVLTIFSDESGSFAKNDCCLYCFGGLIFTSVDSVYQTEVAYRRLEDNYAAITGHHQDKEIKGQKLKNVPRLCFLTAVDSILKFGSITYVKELDDDLLSHPKLNRRFIDYIYTETVCNCLQNLILSRRLPPSSVTEINFFIDYLNSPTDLQHELGNSLAHALSLGRYDLDLSTYDRPVFPNTPQVNLSLCDSKEFTLIRAADILANTIYSIEKGTVPPLQINNLILSYFPVPEPSRGIKNTNRAYMVSKNATWKKAIGEYRPENPFSKPKPSMPTNKPIEEKTRG